MRGRGSLSARTQVEPPERLRPFIDERLALLDAPLTGIQAGDARRNDVFPLAAAGVSTATIVDAAQAFVEALSPSERHRATLPLDAPDWRKWINIHINLFRHGVMLEDLSDTNRKLALELLRPARHIGNQDDGSA